MKRHEYYETRRAIRICYDVARLSYEIDGETGGYEEWLEVAQVAESRFPFNVLKHQKSDSMIDRPSLSQRLAHYQDIPF